MTKRLTDEEKVAKKITEMISNLNLDLDMIGFYIARYERTIIHNRLQVIAESAQFEKEKENDRNNPYTLF